MEVVRGVDSAPAECTFLYVLHANTSNRGSYVQSSSYMTTRPTRTVRWNSLNSRHKGCCLKIRSVPVQDSEKKWAVVVRKETLRNRMSGRVIWHYVYYEKMMNDIVPSTNWVTSCTCTGVTTSNFNQVLWGFVTPTLMRKGCASSRYDLAMANATPKRNGVRWKVLNGCVWHYHGAGLLLQRPFQQQVFQAEHGKI